ncbi:MAG: hypothetical protein L0Y35_08810 [Flammeovirgaceae bacterium]|nr:hypothetical protein [Flammeovirgaceae bacterium]
MKVFATVFALLMMVSFAHPQTKNDSLRSTKIQNNAAMEFVGIAKFKIKPEFSDEQMLKAEKEIRKAMAEQAGFLFRELGKFPDGYWIVSIHWKDKESGSKWTENSKKYQAVQNQHQMIDFSTMRMEFYEKQIIN